MLRTRAYLLIATTASLLACRESSPQRPDYIPDLQKPATAFEEVGAQALNNNRINVSVHGRPGQQSLVVEPSSDHWHGSCLRHTVVQPMDDQLWSVLLKVSGDFRLPIAYGWDGLAERNFLSSNKSKEFIPNGTGIHRAFNLKGDTKPLHGNVYLSDWPDADGPNYQLLPTVVQFQPDYMTTSVTQRECVHNQSRLASELADLNDILSPLVASARSSVGGGAGSTRP